MKAFPSSQDGAYKYLGVVDGVPKFEIVEPAEKHAGMDLRDYFAGKALQGLLADYSQRNTMENFARESYKMADAMMKVRSSNG